ncbi:type III effector [Xanthomonas translucens]|uniref:Type III effector n=1 Tax=Xanthomonas translucens pv. translucens TaxID=134875 RepID=A0ABW9KUF5_XANCT|nr:type III effector [Xanthomonas translucens]MCS3359435.1 type III effector [Xanthomonas translucens pv. translucens]MCS3372630.1 type III effector [Xanthomonas translucens pv. translucens]MCT8273947.1 type III effector [Xanthomonas translucens pv. translucens]MCT8277835.1 type III effector [Xanthomonas translucens pv. translucens]MCT8284733.1 type III effector [Xanthomonas translucens pv. translucens]
MIDMPKINRSNQFYEPSTAHDGLTGFSQEPVVKLHQYSSPEFLGLSSFRSKKVNVNSSTIENLKLAEEAVMKTKYLLPYGAGNQKTDVSYTQGESWARQAMLRDNEYNENPIQNAGKAAVYQAGNCGEHANVAYTLLAAKSLNAPLLRVNDRNQDHAYVLIGDPRDRTWGEKDTVVVDAWVTHPAATTLEQSNDLSPNVTPLAQRAPRSQPDPRAVSAYANVTPVSTEMVNAYLMQRGAHPIGSGLVENMDTYADTGRFFNERTSAADPSTKYRSSIMSSNSFDKIMYCTIDNENSAHTAWQNNGCRW